MREVTSFLESLCQKSQRIDDLDYLFSDHPEVGDDTWKFYLFCVVQQCGTGIKSSETHLSCSSIWKLYFEDWNAERKLFGKSLTFDDFISEFRSRGLHASDGHLFTRYMMHQELSALVFQYGKSVLHRNVLERTGCYGMVDPYKKKLYLLRMILEKRPESFPVQPYFAVIDYHVMRVLLRGCAPDISGDSAAKEKQLRNFAASTIEALVHDRLTTYHKIDTYLWNLGREICTYDSPKCDRCPLSPSCRKSLEQEPRIETFAY